MKILSKAELKLDGFEKCYAIVDSDCPLGQLFDYSCVLKSFVMQKMKEAEAEAESAEKKPVA